MPFASKPHRQLFIRLMGIGALGICIAFLVALVAGDSVDGFPARSAAVIAFGAMLLGVGTMLWAIGSFLTSIWKKESQTVPGDKLLDAEDERPE